MIFRLVFAPEALEHLEYWKRSGQKKTLQRILALFEELSQHPDKGTGKPERLRGSLSGFWSRRIDKASRLVYRIKNDVIEVLIVSMRGHYDEK